MKEVFLGTNNSFIGAWYLEDSTICDDLIKFFEESEQFQEPGRVVYESGSQVNKSVKNSIDIGLAPGFEVADRYVVELQKVLDAYKSKYPESDYVPSYGIEEINLQKYPLGGGYLDFHFERNCNENSKRHLVFMTYLNDITDEGGTEFKYQDLVVTPKKGLTLIWPVDWTHTHRGIPSQSQVKYIATGWYKFL